MVELNTLPILWYPTMVSYVILDRESLQTGRVVGKESLDVLVPNNVGYYDPGMSSVRPAVALGIGKCSTNTRENAIGVSKSRMKSIVLLWRIEIELA